ncbi:hypothetical protein Fbal_1063 [Ferrimonas balearica DSM 9799]|uniref:Flagellar hook-length control protein-like C-terminal domain-containing protein n=1 Tax=Ferrimonas balearica (strain DSM 9799 / CCM 4581 / KCTC 23876 / PAT) TaxID=550540 RepID=E1SUT1_FERBD|nr:hypothetical protein [Ferrimonas balearica]ADN75272.1 hypothetical protein Fbal_1063 [Ferrimonas balearica DSM 9799]
MIPISGSASVQLSANNPQLAPTLVAAKVVQSSGLLKVQTGQRTLSFQMPANPPQGAIALQSLGGSWVLRPLLSQSSPQPIPANIQQTLPQPGPTGQLLLPLRQAGGQTVVMLANGPQALPLPLPPGNDWWLRITDNRQWQLVRPGAGQPLQAAPQDTPTPALPVTPSGTQPRPFESPGTPGWQQLMQALGQQFGQSQLSQLPLPSLAQLAHPALLAALFSQVGQFPYGSRMAPPLGPLATLWQRLLLPRGRGERSELGRATEALSDAQRQQALAALTPMVDDLAQFQQQSQSDPDNPLLYLALPYGQEREQRQLQLALQRYPGGDEASEPGWLLTLRFELSNGDLMLKARYHSATLSLDATASTLALSDAVTGQFEALRCRLIEAGLEVGGLRCRQGDVPRQLGVNSAALTYGGTPYARA